MTGLLITARVGSSRLPEKHLIRAYGRPLLYWLIKRFEKEFKKEIISGEVQLIIASSEEPANRKFREATGDTHCKLFFGSDNNIPLRHLQCAQAFRLSHIVSIDGDDILCSPHAARLIYEQMRQDKAHDLFAVTGLPLGMNVSGYTVEYLEKSLAGKKEPKLETGWGRIFINPRTWERKLGSYDIMGDLRFTLDYEEDARFFCMIIERLKEKTIDISDEELITFVLQNQFGKINAALKKKYWENYNTEKQKEINGNKENES